MKPRILETDNIKLYYKQKTEIQKMLLEWIENNLKGGRGGYRNSYELKHIFTKDTGIYIENGAMKQALKISGVKIQDETKSGSWNVLVNRDTITNFYK